MKRLNPYTKRIPDDAAPTLTHQKAGIARAAIESQTGSREHAHREVAERSTEHINRFHRTPEDRRAEAVVELEKALEDQARTKHEIDALVARYNCTGERSHQGHWSNLQDRLATAKIRVQKAQGKLSAIREEVRRERRSFADCFVDCARLLLSQEVFNEIRGAAHAMAKGHGLKIEASNSKDQP